MSEEYHNFMRDNVGRVFAANIACHGAANAKESVKETQELWDALQEAMGA